MMMRCLLKARRHALLLVLLLLLGSIGCGGRHFFGPSEQDPGDGALAGKAAPAAPLNNLPVQQPYGQAGGGINLPGPGEMLDTYLASRSASYILEDIRRQGADYLQPPAACQRVEIVGTAARFSPDFTGSASGFGGVAVAVYAFTLPDNDLSNRLRLGWAGAPPAPQNCWIAFSDFGKDRWDFYTGIEEWMVTPPAFDMYIDYAGGSNVMLVAVLMLGQAQATLDYMQIASEINGVVLDTDGNPVPSARLRAPGLQPVKVDDNGRYDILELAPSDRLALQVVAAGYVPQSVVMEVAAGAVRTRDITLCKRAPLVQIDPSQDQTISTPGGGEVLIPANALKDSNGQPLTRPTFGSVTLYDLENETGLRATPGDFSARMMDGSQSQLESFGMINVQIMDGLGASAQLGGDTEAVIKIPIPENVRGRAPKKMGLYGFDETTGTWIEQGQLTLDESLQFYTTTVRHFSPINCDQPIPTTAIAVAVVDQDDVPQQGICVFAQALDSNTWSWGCTDRAGIACLQVSLATDFNVFAQDKVGYTKSATVTSPGYARNCSDGLPVISATLRTRKPGRAVLHTSEPSGNVPLAVTFDASASFPSSGATIVSYNWDLDGSRNGLEWSSSGTEPVVTQSYSATGIYRPMLRVVDSNGAAYTATTTVAVVSPATPDSPCYLPGRDTQRTNYVLALGPEDPKIIWTYTLLTAQINPLALDGTGNICFTTTRDMLYTLTPAGKLRWLYVMGNTNPSAGLLTSLGGTFYVHRNQGISVYSSEHELLDEYDLGSISDLFFDPTGAVLYRKQDEVMRIPPGGGLPKRICSGLPVFALDGNFYGVRTDAVEAFAPNGSPLWSIPLMYSPGTMPVTDSSGYLYFGCQRGTGGLLLGISPEGQFVTNVRTDTPIIGGLAVGPDDTIYFNCSNPGLHAVSTYGDILWSLPDIGTTGVPPAVDGAGTIYTSGQWGELVAVNPDGTTKWQLSLPAYINGTPVIGSDGTIYLRIGNSGADRIVAIGEK